MRIILFLSLCMTGIYFEYQSCILSIALLFVLYKTVKEDGVIVLRKNYYGLFFLILTLFYLCSTFWAVDSHMAFWGFLKFLPLIIFTIILMQSGFNKAVVLDSLPIMGTALVLISLVGSQIPVLKEYFLVNGRLAGTFQYPNTFAIFLLVALLYLLTQSNVSLKMVFQTIVLISGILLTGSRTVYLILPLALIAACFLVRDKKNRAVVVTLIFLLAVATMLLLFTGKMSPLSRILNISLSESTLLGRLLYWKNALPVILKHPFGLGYMGYYFAQGSFQTGVYSVTHAHNEFVQLFLDTGWITGTGLIGLFFVGFWKAKNRQIKLLIAVLGLHCLMDFDLQFIAVYMILMLLLPFEQGKEWEFKASKGQFVVSGGIAAILLYFCVGNAVYHFGSASLAQNFYPQNTLAQIEELHQTENAENLAEKAEQILAHNEYVSLAWSAKARVEFSQGNIELMIEDKRQAISLARYNIEEYEDYLKMLITAAQLYQQSGDHSSAEYCLAEAMEIPEQLEIMKEETDALAWKLTDKPKLGLSKEYQSYLDMIKQN